MHDDLQQASEAIKRKRLFDVNKSGLNFIEQRKKSMETLKVIKFLRKSAAKTVKSNDKSQQSLQEENYAYN